MKYEYKVTVEVSDATPISKQRMALMIKRDVGSWEGSLPLEDQVHITNVSVVGIAQRKPKEK